MKRILTFALVAMLVLGCFMMAGCGNNGTIIVQTNPFFAPFEYLDGQKIIGVDVEIMNLVGEKLNKKVQFDNVSFNVIIDNVSAGKVCDAGAAGITVTDARKEKVDFSNTYYTSVQYVIYKKGTMTIDGTAANGENYILWDSLKGKKIGVQLDTTGHLYVAGEIDEGVLTGSNAAVEAYSSAQVASSAMAANSIDVVVIDELPASFIVNSSDAYECAPLYYKGGEGEADTPTVESYAICVTKGNDELLKAINEVLAELGEDGVEALVKKHMGLN